MAWTLIVYRNFARCAHGACNTLSLLQTRAKYTSFACVHPPPPQRPVTAQDTYKSSDTHPLTMQEKVLTQLNSNTELCSGSPMGVMRMPLLSSLQFCGLIHWSEGHAEWA